MRLETDTDPAMARKQQELLQSMTGAQRLTKVVELNRAVDQLARAGIRDRFPNASDREVFLRLAVRKLGPELARLAYPEIDGLER